MGLCTNTMLAVLIYLGLCKLVQIVLCFLSQSSFFLTTMAPAMKAMKAKAAMKTGGVMTQTAVLSSVAETNGLKTKQAKGVVEALMAVACDQIKKHGSFKLAHAQHEVEEEGRQRGKEGHQPIHQGTLRLQGQAGIQDGQVLCNEETQVGAQLRECWECPRTL